MIFHRPPNKRYHLLSPDMSAMETVVLRLSPYSVGRIGGEMARRMVDAAETYLEELTAGEIKRAFRDEIHEDMASHGSGRPKASATKGLDFSTVSPSAGEAPANQYPSGNENH